MILLDSSVLFDHTRGRDPRLAIHFSNLPIAVCGVVRAEVLCGARHPADRAALIRLLNGFAQVSTPESIWDVVGDTLATLRTNGVTIPFPDAVLATLAIVNDLELWTRDNHFALIQTHLPALKLFQEPP
jgi:predicted nucleic acid-binding protein